MSELELCHGDFEGLINFLQEQLLSWGLAVGRQSSLALSLCLRPQRLSITVHMETERNPTATIIHSAQVFV